MYLDLMHPQPGPRALNTSPPPPLPLLLTHCLLLVPPAGLLTDLVELTLCRSGAASHSCRELVGGHVLARRQHSQPSSCPPAPTSSLPSFDFS